MTDAFLCHSSKDARLSLRLVAHLESAGHTCWISERDVAPGESYPREIMEALADSRLVVLLLTENSNSSAHVHREVERAASAGLPLITYRAENVSRLTPELEYFLSTSQWLDATDGKHELHLSRLAERVAAVVNDEPAAPTEQERPPVRSRAHRSRAAVLIAALAAVIVAAVTLTGVFRSDSKANSGANAPKTGAPKSATTPPESKEGCLRAQPVDLACKALNDGDRLHYVFPLLRNGCEQSMARAKQRERDSWVAYRQCPDSMEGSNAPTLSYVLYKSYSQAITYLADVYSEDGVAVQPTTTKEPGVIQFGPVPFGKKHGWRILWLYSAKYQHPYSVSVTCRSKTVCVDRIKVVPLRPAAAFID